MIKIKHLLNFKMENLPESIVKILNNLPIFFNTSLFLFLFYIIKAETGFKFNDEEYYFVIGTINDINIY